MAPELSSRPGEVPGGIDLGRIAEIGSEEEKNMAARLLKVREGRAAERQMAPPEAMAAVEAAAADRPVHATKYQAQEISRAEIAQVLAKVEAAATKTEPVKTVETPVKAKKSLWSKIFG